MQVRKNTNETHGRYHHKPKAEVSVVPQKELMSSKFFLKSICNVPLMIYCYYISRAMVHSFIHLQKLSAILTSQTRFKSQGIAIAVMILQ